MTKWPCAAQILQLIIYNEERLIFQKAWSANFSNLPARLHNFHPLVLLNFLVNAYRRLKRHVFVCQGHSRNFFFLSNSNETVKGYFKAGFLFLSHIGHVPFVEHVGSVQLLSKNKTARDILTQEVFVFLVRFVHTCISLFCHLCLLLLCFCDPMLYMLHSPK